MSKGKDGQGKAGGKAQLSLAEQQRRLRTAQKLRENLARRKLQARARRAGEAENGEGLPAANLSDPDATGEDETPSRSDSGHKPPHPEG